MVGLLNLLAGDSNIGKSLERRGVVEHLLQEQKASGIVMAANHHPIAEGLTKRVGRHAVGEAEVAGDAFEGYVDGLSGQRVVLVLSPIGFRPEHIVAQAYAGSMFEIKRYGFDDGVVNSDVAVLLPNTGVTGLLLEDGEAVFEGEVRIDDVGEPKRLQVRNAEPKVDTDDEQHVVPIPALLY